MQDVTILRAKGFFNQLSNLSSLLLPEDLQFLTRIASAVLNRPRTSAQQQLRRRSYRQIENRAIAAPEWAQ